MFRDDSILEELDNNEFQFPPDPYTAMDYLQPILTKNPKHGVAHWYMARCYQAQGHNYSSKGRKVY
ncbi:hypothetical protein [Coleofasciculus sp. F4-SAH-05]|uniref:hypothetical protein n=1 Tax=Coleofasciculus sp. F4-SAH-05 TaxID=3069525 RepID=UPI00330491C0